MNAVIRTFSICFVIFTAGCATSTLNPTTPTSTITTGIVEKPIDEITVSYYDTSSAYERRQSDVIATNTAYNDREERLTPQKIPGYHPGTLTFASR